MKRAENGPWGTCKEKGMQLVRMNQSQKTQSDRTLAVSRTVTSVFEIGWYFMVCPVIYRFVALNKATASFNDAHSSSCLSPKFRVHF